MEKSEIPPPETSSRFEAFANFFKRYMGVSSVVTAALPIPVTALGAIPTYGFQTKILSTYTSLFCFLILGFIFYSRHQLARAMFPEFFQQRTSSRNLTSALTIGRAFVKLLPLLLILGSISCAFKYQHLLISSVVSKREKFELPPNEVTDLDILTKGLESQTPESTWLMLYYLGIFMTAEAAFILMAIKEHLQDLATLAEMDLIRGPSAKKVETTCERCGFSPR
jgi:hypothetical protein